MRSATAFVSLSLLALFSIAGCGKAPPPKIPDTVPVKGTVKLDGKPMDRGVITFLPSAAKSYRATGFISQTGEYELSTSVGATSKPGASPGEYTVTISRFLNPKGEPQDPTKPVEIPGLESLPPRYSNATQTTLKATIPTGGGTQDFDVKAK